MSNRELLSEKGNVKVFICEDDCAQNPWSPNSQDLPFEYHLEANRSICMRSENFPFKPNHPDYWYEPIFAYIHSGITIGLTPFSCRWDSGTLGYVAVKRPSKGGEFKNRKAFRKSLASYVKTLDDYLQGYCYGYEVETDGNLTDSCWGFIGKHSESGLLDAIREYL